MICSPEGIILTFQTSLPVSNSWVEGEEVEEGEEELKKEVYKTTFRALRARPGPRDPELCCCGGSASTTHYMTIPKPNNFLVTHCEISMASLYDMER